MATLSGRYRPQRGGTSRLLEDVAFLVGVLLIAGKFLVEISLDLRGVPSQHSAFTVLLEFLRVSVLVVPKMLGRATGGRVWGALGAGVGKLVSRGKPGGPE